MIGNDDPAGTFSCRRRIVGSEAAALAVLDRRAADLEPLAPSRALGEAGGGIVVVAGRVPSVCLGILRESSQEEIASEPQGTYYRLRAEDTDEP